MSLPPPTHRPLEPIPRRKIVAGVIAVAVLTVASVILLWWAGTRGLQGKDLVAERLDALKVGLSIGVGSGGLFALYLGWRRQRSTEADLDNRERALRHQQQIAATTEARQDRVDADARLDARERRITELYTKAADQLGSDKAAVRLAGLYALERLAQGDEPQRQTIVNVLCAYLRMPFALPGAGTDDENRERTQEREVRSAAQRILRLHLQEPGSDAFWHDADIDLTGAVLVGFSFSQCQVRTGTFNRAHFHGLADFRGARIVGNGRFNEARFLGDARFIDAEVGGTARFSHAKFGRSAWFRRARFLGDTRFNGAEFDEEVSFAATEFADATDFRGVSFQGADFTGATFAERVPLDVARFVD